MIAGKDIGAVKAGLIAKAENGVSSTAIVVSFDAHWLEPISKGHVSLVLRKRVPQSVSPTSMYIYINSPASVLMGRAPIRGILTLSPSETLKRQSELGLTKDAINAYLQGSVSVGAYELGRVETATNPLQLHWLRQNMAFNPPQSFFFLASKAQAVIDRHARFARATKLSKRK